MLMPIRFQNGLKIGPEATGESLQDGKHGTKQPSKPAAPRLDSKRVGVSSTEALLFSTAAPAEIMISIDMQGHSHSSVWS